MTEPLERLQAALADRYRFEREIGAGGMATVYLAEDLRHHRKVAVKVLHPELAAVLGADRFLAEIQTTANLQHPHILPLHDSGQADGLLFYVMPYVEGETLRARISREQQLPIEDAVRITKEVASALDYAHRHGVIHRDIKPENILLHEGQALIADFGIALAVSSAGGPRMTQTGMSLGTPEYMSPEQALGERTITAKSDLYALGCVLYEMLTGEPPFTGATVQAIVSKVMQERPIPPRSVRDTVPVQVEAAALQALAKLPADRFATAAEFATALTAGQAVPYPASQVVPKAVGVSGRVRYFGAAAVMALIGWLGWLTLAPAGTQAPIPQVLQIPVSLSAPPRLRNPWGEAVRISRDGTKLLYYSNNSRYHVLDLRTNRSAPIADAHTSIDAVFSPGGDSVVFRTGGWVGQLWITDLVTRRESMIADSGMSWMDWAKDGWIYFRDLTLNISRVRVADGRREVVFTRADADSTLPEHPQLIPGGRGILYSRRRRVEDGLAQAEIAVFDLRTRTSRGVLRGVKGLVTPTGYLLAVQSNGALIATRFDTDALSALGTPVVVADSVSTAVVGMYLWGAFDISENGTLVYVRRASEVDDTVTIVGGDGKPISGGSVWGGWVGEVEYDGDTQRALAEVTPGLNRPEGGRPNIWARDNPLAPPRRLTFGEVLDYYPRFRPGGAEVTFVSPRGGHNWDLYSVPFDGSGPAEVILDRAGDIRAPRFSGDGKLVVFCERDFRDRLDVHAHRFGPDSSTVPVAATAANECYPDVTADGKWVAYQSDRSGRDEIYVRAITPDGATSWQVSTEGGTSPRWSERGDQLYFLSASREVMAVDVSLTAGFRFGESRRLFALDEVSSWGGSLLRGGRGFAVVRRRLEAAGQMMMVQNFFGYLKQVVGQ